MGDPPRRTRRRTGFRSARAAERDGPQASLRARTCPLGLGEHAVSRENPENP